MLILLIVHFQVGGSLAKVVYFTRSPEPPASPSVAATRGGSPPSNITTPSPSTSPSNTSPAIISSHRHGALTPMVLDNGAHTSLDEGSLHSSLLRRASVQHFPGGSLNFVRFETEKIDECVEFIQSLIHHSATLNGVSIEEMRKGVKIMATGGGAHKFYDLFSSVLEVEVRREDEIECLIEGLKFITLIPDEVYYFSDELIHYHSHLSHAEKQKNDPDQLERPSANPPLYGVIFERNPTPQLPCLLVNIGSGVSVIKIDEDGKFERVSGTSLGGGTLWGLLSLMTPATSFDGKL